MCSTFIAVCNHSQHKRLMCRHTTAAANYNFNKVFLAAYKVSNSHDVISK